jgi:hypothetical protein
MAMAWLKMLGRTCIESPPSSALFKRGDSLTSHAPSPQSELTVEYILFTTIDKVPQDAGRPVERSSPVSSPCHGCSRGGSVATPCSPTPHLLGGMTEQHTVRRQPTYLVRSRGILTYLSGLLGKPHSIAEQRGRRSGALDGLLLQTTMAEQQISLRRSWHYFSTFCSMIPAISGRHRPQPFETPHGENRFDHLLGRPA